ncbi:hypothetical protein [Leifsonia sp. NPDC058248]|uniref:hypothetical protein n=1 Tax=Leifsonia sp. NPDC058248 TaxID=3346402 RepID=UPI0036DBC75D
MRNPAHGRLWTGLALTVTVTLALTACHGDPPPSVIKEGIAAAKSDLKAIFGDLSATARAGEHDAPPVFTKATTSSEVDTAGDQLIRELNEYKDAYARIGTAAQTAMDIDLGIPDDAYALAAAAFMGGDRNPKFEQYVDELAEKLVRGLMCQGLRKVIDAQAQAEEQRSGIDYQPIDPNLALTYVIDRLNEFSHDWAPYINSAKLAEDATGKAQAIIESVDGIITAPNGTIRQADFLYLRSCVVKSP